jgi:carbonic anhydrase
MISNTSFQELLEMKKTMASVAILFAGIIWSTNYVIKKLSSENTDEQEQDQLDQEEENHSELSLDTIKSSSSTLNLQTQIDGKIKHIGFHLDMIRELFSDLQDLVAT